MIQLEAQACNIRASSNGPSQGGRTAAVICISLFIFKFQPKYSDQLSIPYFKLTEVGLGLIGFGISFAFLGVSLFFDRGLLALGNILWLAGVVILIGWYSTLQLFRKNYKGTACFILGLFFLFVRWPIVVAFGLRSVGSSVTFRLLDGLYSIRSWYVDKLFSVTSL
ncbi:hypothetical protein Godav_016329 [Gossypium davidsonii]|uniref:Uncharacterized protein n=1 Tax=Gossypium davidsonii TaxID=34287 RepID=A0A7J8RRS8_GOSDV|nr:hypothetical protein [Gossypium davidsonii]